MAMSTYNLQANGNNGTHNTTRVGALSNFYDEAVWLVDATGGGPELGGAEDTGQDQPPATPTAISGISGNSPGVVGNSSSNAGVLGTSDSYAGVSGAGTQGVYGTGDGGVGVVGAGYAGAPGMVGMSFANGNNLGTAAGVLGASTGDSARDPEDPGAVTGAGVVGLSVASIYSGPGLDIPGISLPDPNSVPTGNGTGVWGASGGGTGVHGQSENGRGGIFESASAAQLRLIPSATPLEDSPTLMQGGQPGDLYLFSVAQEVGTTGTYDYTTILWLCIAPAVERGQALWAQVPLGDTVGG
jgi:hypothetical protein